MTSRLVFTVPQIATALACGRNAAYALVSTGQIRSIRIGRSLRIPASALAEFLGEAIKENGVEPTHLDAAQEFASGTSTRAVPPEV